MSARIDTQTINPKLVTFDPDERARKTDPRDSKTKKEIRGRFEELKNSIKAQGVISPITITRDNVLVFGWRRLIAWMEVYKDAQLMPEIPFVYVGKKGKNVSRKDLRLMELAENNYRESWGHWLEPHNLIIKIFDEDTNPNASPDERYVEVAEDSPYTAAQVKRHILVRDYQTNDALNRQFPGGANKRTDLYEMGSFIQAWAPVKQLIENQNAQKRREAARAPTTGEPVTTEEKPSGTNSEETSEGTSEEKPEGTEPNAEEPSPIHLGDFLTWKPEEGFDPFSFIHCDFPYGINLHKAGGKITKREDGKTYLDTKDVYSKLLNRLVRTIDDIAAEKAHLMFWFSMDHYALTYETLSAMEGWYIDPTPLVWDRGVRGIAPDVHNKTRFRKSSEFAFFGFRGNAKMYNVRCNVVRSLVTKQSHQSEKPVQMLYRFFGGFVDSTTTFFDPTCGGGSSVLAAKLLGAQSVYGLEIDEENALKAAKHYNRWIGLGKEVEEWAQNEKERRSQWASATKPESLKEMLKTETDEEPEEESLAEELQREATANLKLDFSAVMGNPEGESK